MRKFTGLKSDVVSLVLICAEHQARKLQYIPTRSVERSQKMSRKLSNIDRLGRLIIKQKKEMLKLYPLESPTMFTPRSEIYLAGFADGVETTIRRFRQQGLLSRRHHGFTLDLTQVRGDHNE